MKVKGNDGGEFQQAPVGTHIAICDRVIDLGTQEKNFNGDISYKHEIMLEWELPLELMEDGPKAGQPFTVSKFYTFSINEKANLRHDLVSWRGRDFTKEELDGFEMANILGKPCTLTISENENGRRKVTAIGGIIKGTKVPKAVNAPVMFSLDPDEFDANVYEGLSDRLKERIALSPEFTQATHGAPKANDYSDVDFGNPADDDIPF